jgi:hypothetical protein
MNCLEANIRRDLSLELDPIHYRHYCLMRVSMNLGFSKFLIMPPAYYKYDDNDVINFYSKIII